MSVHPRRSEAAPGDRNRPAPRPALGRLLLLLLPMLVGSGGGCWHARYLAQQGAGQWRLLRARRRIADVLRDPGAPDELKRRLRLALEARSFGVRVLGLRDGDAFTRFLDTGDEPVAWEVSAAEKDRLRPHLIRFPIAGAVPYLGFFREADALAEERRLKAAGYDTSVREVAGYSTLGFFADPIYSSMLEGPDARIVEVTLHEMLHGTLYLPGRSEWNESLATFVGVHGAAAFFAARGAAGEVARVLDEAREAERRQEAFARFLEPILQQLEALYGSARPREEKLRLREAIFERARRGYVRQFPPRPGGKPGAFGRGPINNAVLVGFAVYHRSTPEHRRVYRLLGGDLAAMIRLYRHAVEDEADPITYLRAWGAGGAG